MINFHVVMQSLRGKRPVFHSEADFQHALAMELSTQAPRSQIRLEYRPMSDERIYIDLWALDKSQKLAVELKYKTRLARVDWKDERFDLANQGAQDLSAYDVWKDVQRLERVCTQRADTNGYVILLSNDATFWNAPASNGTVGSAFRLHEGRVASGGLYWASHAGDGTMKNRENPIELNGSYRIEWHDYSRLGPGQGLTFRYTLIHVSGKNPTIVEQPEPQALKSLTEKPTPKVTSVIKPSKYSPLYDFLASYSADRIELSYTKIEEIIGSSLPPSSRKHPSQFWANHYGGTHVWATKWMDAGWRVDSHNVGSERVVFIRTSDSVGSQS